MTRTEKHIRALCKWPHRGSAGAYEGLAAEYARKALEEQDYHVDVECFRAPRSGLYPTYLLICAWAAIGCGLAFFSPVPAIFIALLPFLYLAAEFYLLRPVHNLLFPGGMSRNVIARGSNPDAKARVILTAHLDTQLGSYLFSPRWIKFQPLILNSVTVCAIAALLLSILRAFGMRGAIITVAQLAVIVVLACCFVLYAIAEWTGEYVQGANDDASGAAIILALAEDLRKVPPENIEVWIVATGAEESGLCGMANFLRKGRGRELDKESTYFINFDNLGGGDLVYLTGETIPGFKYPGSLVELAEKTAKDSHAPDAQPGWWPVPTDALLSALRGYPTVTMFGYDGKGRTPNYHYSSDTVENVDFDLPEKARAFVLELIRKLNRQVSETETPQQ